MYAHHRFPAPVAHDNQDIEAANYRLTDVGLISPITECIGKLGGYRLVAVVILPLGDEAAPQIDLVVILLHIVDDRHNVGQALQRVIIGGQRHQNIVGKGKSVDGADILDRRGAVQDAVKVSSS